ncbi:MAG: hypothetical protein IPG71_11515 [bacterium]|nr:hypothetical protein [bacterium]
MSDLNTTPVSEETKPAWEEEVLFKGRKVKRSDLPEERQRMTQEAQDLANLYRSW